MMTTERRKSQRKMTREELRKEIEIVLDELEAERKAGQLALKLSFDGKHYTGLRIVPPERRIA